MSDPDVNGLFSTEEQLAWLEEQMANDAEEDDELSDAEKRAALRDAGFDIPYTKGDLLDELFAELSDTAPMMLNERGMAEWEAARADRVMSIYSAMQQMDAPKGRTFRPQTIQQPSQRQILGEAQEATMGPDPQSLFRDVFTEAFPEMGRKVSPYQRFVQKQEKELEAKFKQNVFNELTTPGTLDKLRGDYENLVRQQEQGSFAGAGGSVPAFSDFIKTRFQSNYLSFLAGEKPKLQRAFELASPEERGQRDRGQIAPMTRKL